MSEISRSLLSTLREEINSALAPVAAKHGITLHAGNASYTSTSFTFKLEGRGKSAEGKPMLSELEKRSLVMEINHPSVTEENVAGFQFKDTRTGRTQTIVGYNSKAPKYSVRLVDDQGTASKAPGGYVRLNIPYQPVKA